MMAYNKRPFCQQKLSDDDPVGRGEHTDCFRFIFFGEKNRRDGEFTGTTEGAGSERVVDFLRIVLVIRS